MRSKHADKFNHDEDAAGYDADVRDESNPIRAGYARMLQWCVDEAHGARSIVDLGGGTGNTLLGFDSFDRAVLVDVSTKMLDIAREKLAGKTGVSFVQKDLLEFFDDFSGPADAIVSTYAIHHLTAEEKDTLFERIHGVLPPGGRAVFGDLMFRDADHEQAMRAKYPNLVEDFDDEFFWDAGHAKNRLEELGFAVTVHEFSDLSRGIVARAGF